ncbi:MAG: hypothetical protein ABIQ39_07560 [Ilumatobacteraceae bacterium]
MTAILAHQGGWDEILMVLGPILLIVGLLRLAKRRIADQHPTSEGTPGADHTVATPPVDTGA